MCYVDPLGLYEESMIFLNGEIVSVQTMSVSEYNDRKSANENRESSGTTQLPTTQPAESDATQTQQAEGTTAPGNTIIPAAQTTPTTTGLDTEVQTTPAKKEDTNTPKLQAQTTQSSTQVDNKANVAYAGAKAQAATITGVSTVASYISVAAANPKSIFYGAKSFGKASVVTSLAVCAIECAVAGDGRQRAQAVGACAGGLGLGLLGGAYLGPWGAVGFGVAGGLGGDYVGSNLYNYFNR